MPHIQWQGVEVTYFVRMVVPGRVQPVKIGRSKSLFSRLESHACSSPFPLEILASFPYVLLDERELHRLFAEDHMRGEWFRLSRRMRALIQDIQDLTAIYPAEEVDLEHMGSLGRQSATVTGRGAT
jgi:hypothetical protein